MGKLDKKILQGEEWEDSRTFISGRQIKARKCGNTAIKPKLQKKAWEAGWLT